MPSKLLIPFYNSEDNLIRISKGSNPDSPYPIGVSSAKPLMVLESKLDTILIAQEPGEHIGVLGMGTTEMKFNPLVWIMIKAVRKKQPHCSVSFAMPLIGLFLKNMGRIQEMHARGLT